MSRSQTRTVMVSLVIAIFVTSIAYFLKINQVTQKLEFISYDFRSSYIRHKVDLPDEIIIILIDDPSLQIMNPIVGRWPWPRAIYEDIINFISIGNPNAILFDMLFSENQELQTIPAGTGHTIDTNDKRLIFATQSQGQVFHAMQFLKSKEKFDRSDLIQPLPTNVTTIHAIPPHKLQKIRHKLLTPYNHDSFDEFLAPITGLQDAAKGIGVVNIVTDPDGVYRRSPLLFPYDNKLYPAFSTVPILTNNTHLNTLENTLNSIIQISGHDTTPKMWINFYDNYRPLSMSGLLSSISSFQQGDVKNLLVNPDIFTNKYVFIGASAIGLHDLKPTPLHTLAPGVFIHASVLGNLLSNDILLPAPIYLTYISIFILSLITSFAVLSTHKIIIQVSLPIAISLVFFALCLVTMYNNWILSFVTPFLAILMSWFLAFIFLFSSEEKERKQIRTMFSQYVSPDALKVMVDQYQDYKTAASGTKEIISILFSDIRGFTTLSEQLDAEHIVRVLNFYFSAMTDVIFKHNGTVDKFIGDAIMATWGAPIKTDRHAIDSVRTAIDMVMTLESVNKWLNDQSFASIQIGIGVNTGTAIMGSIGSQQKADYTVIGDTVNLSSRLEGITKIYDRPIIISESTYRELDENVPCQILDCVQVKGKNTAINIYSPVIYGDHHDAKTLAHAQEVAHQSSHAFSQFQQRNWLQTKEILIALPPEYQNKTLLDQCQRYLQSPPDASWQGVTVLTSK